MVNGVYNIIKQHRTSQSRFQRGDRIEGIDVLVRGITAKLSTRQNSARIPNNAPRPGCQCVSVCSSAQRVSGAPVLPLLDVGHALEHAPAVCHVQDYQRSGRNQVVGQDKH